jgi:4'-phosphopantetheinyl transferase
VRTASIDVWRIGLTRSPGEDRALWDCLQQDERARALRFRFRRDRDRFVAARGALRHILGSYLGSPAASIRFGYAPAGKPFLVDHPELGFNLSHAADLALVSVSRGGEIGVDVEEIQSDEVIDSTSALVLSPPEHEELRRSTGRTRQERFARFWTRKEAYIKADGRGMQLPLDRIDVATSPDRVMLRAPDADRWTASGRWSVWSLPTEAGHAAAVVAEGSGWEVVAFDWAGPSGRQDVSRSRSRQVR